MRSFKVLPAVVALALLTSCAPNTPGPFRDTNTPIGATTRFVAEDFAGAWVMVASFTAVSQAPLSVTYVPDAGHIRIATDAAPEIAGVYREGKPGELVPLSAKADRLVVMWVDDEFNTAAIGTISGSFGAVIDRDGIVREDRARAARDILAFYGWDISALKRTIR